LRYPATFACRSISCIGRNSAARVNRCERFSRATFATATVIALSIAFCPLCSGLFALAVLLDGEQAALSIPHPASSALNETASALLGLFILRLRFFRRPAANIACRL